MIKKSISQENGDKKRYEDRIRKKKQENFEKEIIKVRKLWDMAYKRRICI